MRTVGTWCGFVVVLFLTIPASPVAAQQWDWPEEPENLRVLVGFSGRQLSPVMRGFTRALGVRCSYCHVGEEGQPLTTYDFPSDEKLPKRTARTMLGMLGDINDRLDSIEPSGDRRVNMWCHTCHRGRPRPMILEEELGDTYRAEGIEAALARYDGLREDFYGRGAYDFGEAALNNFGYELLGDGDLDGAVLVFEKNVALFPESSNLYDSLGEGYMERGDTELAITNYEKSLALEPRNRNAVDKLEELRARN
jgi:Photosynthetic reaction centre cytochrome C subunit